MEDETEITVDIMSRLKDKWDKLDLEQKAEAINIMTRGKILPDTDGEEKNAMEITWEEPRGVLIQLSSLEENPTHLPPNDAL